MAEVLSQQEIDQLLSALHSGEIEVSEVADTKDKVKVYDFKRALRYSKENIRSITRIHENFARLLSSYLSTQLRTFVQVEIDLVDQVTYHEFVASIPSRTILNIFEVGPMDGKMVMEINPHIAYAMLERLLGGYGTPAERQGALTEIEMNLMQRIFSQTSSLYQESWSNIEPLRVKWESMESNPQFIQIASQNDTVILIALSTKIGDITGRMALCLPHLMLEPILPKLSTHQWMTASAKSSQGDKEGRIKKKIEIVKVPVTAELGKATLPIQDLLNLQIGDVIGFEMEQLQVKIGQFTRFVGKPGVQKGHYAVQIEKIIQTEGEAEHE